MYTGLEYKRMVEMYNAAHVVVAAARVLYGPVDNPDGPPCEGTCDLCVFEQALLHYDEVRDEIIHNASVSGKI